VERQKLHCRRTFACAGRALHGGDDGNPGKFAAEGFFISSSFSLAKTNALRSPREGLIRLRGSRPPVTVFPCRKQPGATQQDLDKSEMRIVGEKARHSKKLRLLITPKKWNLRIQQMAEPQPGRLFARQYRLGDGWAEEKWSKNREMGVASQPTTSSVLEMRKRPMVVCAEIKVLE
jgi:hypothetical protein